MTSDPNALNWNTIILAAIAIIPGVFAAYFANQAKNRAEGALSKGVENAGAIEVVKKQTDGLATAMSEAGFAKGVKQEQDAAVVTLASDAKQAAMIEAIVSRLLAAQQPQLVKSNGEPMHPPAATDPGPKTAGALAEIKDVVDDVQPRVVAIEDATTRRDEAVEKVAKGADERLTKLEDQLP